MVILTLQVASPIPLELAGILPERLAGQTVDQVARLPVLHGNRSEELGQFFAVQSRGESPGELRMIGDCRNVHGIGRGMSGGEIVVEGSVGRHAGAQMSGGRITITEQAGDWLGAELRGGLIEVRGSVGHCAGAGYRGSRFGMTGGTIWLRSTAGDELGSQMRRGLILAEGRVGAFAGVNMIAGTLLLLAGAGGQLGAGMKRGTIFATGPASPSPGFRFACAFSPPILPLIANSVQQLGPAAPVLPPAMTVHCHRGDVLTGGRGELWFPESPRLNG